jgi:hypothetical protein
MSPLAGPFLFATQKHGQSNETVDQRSRGEEAGLK